MSQASHSPGDHQHHSDGIGNRFRCFFYWPYFYGLRQLGQALYERLLKIDAGLVLERNLIQRILRSEIMRESVIYQEWRAEALSEGRAEGLQRERDLVLRLLTHRLGDLSPDVIQQVQGLPIEAVEALGEALLDFSQPNELFLWLEQQQA